MLVDAMLGTRLDDVAARARDLEARGYGAAFAAETSSDPFLAVLLAAEHTDRIEVGTSIAVAFARSPMTVAQTADDLQRFSGGRFVLGLGSQIKAHIERRFSMPWSQPAARMREFVLAMRAIWSAWHDDQKLDFRGDFYTHTLMTPFFSPPPHSLGQPKVFLAAVGERMTQVAGEVADGMIVHAFSTATYVREVTLPSIEFGLAAAGRTRGQFEVRDPIFVVTGRSDQEREAAATATKRQLAFYASTPGYRGVLELHGWGEIGDELNTLSKRGEWEKMGELFGDEMLDAFAIVAPPDRVAGELLARYAGLVDRVSLNSPIGIDTEIAETIVEGLRTG
jgi:probable F420-dependent oxidoreductase